MDLLVCISLSVYHPTQVQVPSKARKILNENSDRNETGTPSADTIVIVGIQL